MCEETWLVLLGVHYWTSLVAQMVKNLPAMQETWVQSLSWENPLDFILITRAFVGVRGDQNGVTLLAGRQQTQVH